MRITRVDIEGRRGRYATITRRRGSPVIEITVLTPRCPAGTPLTVTASGDEAGARGRQAFAAYLHHVLEGHGGTNSDIHAYYRELERFAD